ncbi:methyltransferase domain-containing protein [Thermoclostridium stercorarium]|uniref:methyltransferase domain-containing protein n=1 Tax=Thermoclostridium stercorarium TaxID=1510 RepID=UPI000AA2F9DE|nr:methyltransferase domain-containing protein [Thermoclostridium stercorarium]
MADYKRIAEHWNEVFGKTETGQIKTTDVGHDDLNKALDWLCFNSESIIDFGCGIGVMLFKCCLRGTKIHKGIDISDKGIRVAMELQRINNFEGFTFTAGGVEELDKIC